MRILAVADTESKYYYDCYTPGKLDGFDLILSCGDLNPEYLEFLATMSCCPVVYVRGNHDECYAQNPPGGCECAEDRLVVIDGLRILGLGGSHRYRKGENLYTEAQMRRRVQKLKFQIWRHGGFDLLLTHAPARNLNDLDTPTHRGFQCFRDLLDTCQPRFFVHGHVHMNYGVHIPRWSRYQNTIIINACDHYEFEA